MLDVIKDNGGATETHLLLAGSPAINTGANPLALALGELTINKPLAIDGDDRVTIDGNNASRIFTVNDQTSTATAVQLSGLVLSHGNVADNGGAIWNAEQLTISNMTLTNNSAVSYGGAVYNSPASATIAGASILLQNSTLDNNTANGDGAIFNNTGALLTVADTTFSTNAAPGSGGAIFNNQGTATLTGSTFVANTTVSGNGGGIYTTSATTLTNCTLSGNFAGNVGGGLFGTSTSVNVRNSTIAYNSSGNQAGGIYMEHSTFNMTSSIVAYNAAGYYPDLRNYNSTFTADHSLVVLAAGYDIVNGVNGNIVGQEAMLFPLGDYGGPTDTHALEVGSPCIGNGSNPLVLANDQRGTGFPREIGTVDMGAVEYMTNTTLTVTVDGNGSGTVSSSPAGIDCGADCEESFDPNMTVVLTAPPGLETVFTGWSGACTGTGTCTLSMTEPRNVTATFALNQYDLNVSKDGTGAGAGTVSSMPAGIDCGSDCSQAYDYNTPVTLTATPATGSTFTGWAGTCTGAGTCEVTMSQARSTTATFTLNQYTVTANANGNGGGTLISNVGGISYTYPAVSTGTTSPLDHGSTITLAANAATGSTVVWNGCPATGGTTTAATCTFTGLNGAKSATATFTLDTFSLTVQLEGSGKGSVTSDKTGIDCGTDCDEGYDYGEVVTLTATPEGKSKFIGWSGACAGSELTCQVTIDQAVSVGARFDNSFPWNLYHPTFIGGGGKQVEIGRQIM